VQRTVTANGETYIEDIYCDEPSCEVVYRKLYNGTETDVGRAVALRTHPLWFELHEMRFSAIERITDNEGIGTVTFSKCDASGRCEACARLAHPAPGGVLRAEYPQRPARRLGGAVRPGAGDLHEHGRDRGDHRLTARVGVSTLGCGRSEVHGWTGSQVPVTKREDHLGGWRRGCPPCRLRRARQAVMYRAMPGEASEA